MSNAAVIAGLFIGIAIGCIYALLMFEIVENDLYNKQIISERPEVFKLANWITIGSIFVAMSVGLIAVYFAQKKPTEQVN